MTKAFIPQEVKSTVLDEARNLIYGDRQVQYGNSEKNFTDIARGWSLILGVPITAEQVVLCMIWLKVMRANNGINTTGQSQRDSIVDIAGYAGCIEKIWNGD